MSYDNLSSVSQNVLKFYRQLTGEERRFPFIFDGKKYLYFDRIQFLSFFFKQTSGEKPVVFDFQVFDLR
jgi:hypothetical protein